MLRLTLTLFVASTLRSAAAEEGCDHPHHQHEQHGHADEDPGHPAHTAGSPHHPHLDLAAEEDAWFHFHPHLSVAIALGGSTSEKNLDLIAGGHAPIDDGFNLQGIELGGVFEFGELLSTHLNYNTFWDRYDGWDGEWEEAFLALKMPAGFAIRGGQFLAPFGIDNQLHLHDRDFVEPSMSMVRLLGEDGLIVQGGELAWNIPSAPRPTTLRVGYGQSSSHSHGEAREFRNELYREALEEAAGGHHAGDDEEHAHGRAGNGGVYHADDAYLDNGYFFARLESQICEHRGINRAGLSFAGGENGFGRNTWIFGADMIGSYAILERPAWWKAEAFYRYVDAYDHSGLPGHFDEVGLYASAGWEFADDWVTATRVEWASGNRMSGNERRWRGSANVGRIIHFGPKADLHTRLQYTMDDLGGYTTEHTVWLQFVLNLGAAEHGHAH